MIFKYFKKHNRYSETLLVNQLVKRNIESGTYIYISSSYHIPLGQGDEMVIANQTLLKMNNYD